MFKFLDNIGETRLLKREFDAYLLPDGRSRTTDVYRNHGAHMAVAAFKEGGGSLRVEGLKEIGNRVAVAALGVAALAGTIAAIQFTRER